MKLVTKPRVAIIQHSMPLMETIQALSDEFSPEGYHKMEDDASVLEVVPIFAGRNCYQSFGSKAGRKTARDYLGHIKEVKHFSVIEHSYVTFFIDGVSRSFTHELVRHRIASYSQLSQRFVAPDNVTFVIPPAQRDKPWTFVKWAALGKIYSWLYARELKDIQKGMTTSEKKAVRESARSVLPNATETKIVMTMNLRAIAEFLQKRNADGVDAEMREVAQLIQEQMEELAPNLFGDKDKFEQYDYTVGSMVK